MPSQEIVIAPELIGTLCPIPPKLDVARQLDTKSAYDLASANRVGLFLELVAADFFFGSRRLFPQNLGMQGH